MHWNEGIEVPRNVNELVYSWKYKAEGDEARSSTTSLYVQSHHLMFLQNYLTNSNIWF